MFFFKQYRLRYVFNFDEALAKSDSEIPEVNALLTKFAEILSEADLFGIEIEPTTQESALIEVKRKLEEMWNLLENHSLAFKHQQKQIEDQEKRIEDQEKRNVSNPLYVGYSDPQTGEVPVVFPHRDPQPVEVPAVWCRGVNFGDSEIQNKM